MTTLIENKIREYEKNKNIVRLHLVTGETIVGVIENHDSSCLLIERRGLARNNKVIVQIKHIIYIDVCNFT